MLSQLAASCFWLLSVIPSLSESERDIVSAREFVNRRMDGKRDESEEKSQKSCGQYGWSSIDVNYAPNVNIKGVASCKYVASMP